jgi:aspartyl protease family protein
VPATEARPRSVVVARNAQGHFDVDGRVNGRRIDFVVDTGASVVALTARDAARLGIRPARNAFVAEVTTANGTVRAAPARLDVVEIGGLELRDVTARCRVEQSGEALLTISSPRLRNGGNEISRALGY